jgi:hypothetical protein
MIALYSQSSVREGLDGPAQLAQLIRRAQAAKRLASKIDADAIAHTVIALLYGSVLQKLWKPDIDSELTIRGGEFRACEAWAAGCPCALQGMELIPWNERGSVLIQKGVGRRRWNHGRFRA